MVHLAAILFTAMTGPQPSAGPAQAYGPHPFDVQFQDHPPMIPKPPRSGSCLMGQDSDSRAQSRTLYLVTDD